MTMSIYETSAGLTALPPAIVRQFNLSAEESTLCLGLVQGKSLDDMADELHRSRAIVRSQFDSLLLKTGTDTEAKLVITVLSNSFVVAS